MRRQQWENCFPPEGKVHEVTILDTDEIDSSEGRWHVRLSLRGDYYTRRFMANFAPNNSDTDAASESMFDRFLYSLGLTPPDIDGLHQPRHRLGVRVVHEGSYCSALNWLTPQQLEEARR
jgi:hypothetical protein